MLRGEDRGIEREKTQFIYIRFSHSPTRSDQPLSLIEKCPHIQHAYQKRTFRCLNVLDRKDAQSNKMILSTSRLSGAEKENYLSWEVFFSPETSSESYVCP